MPSSLHLQSPSAVLPRLLLGRNSSLLATHPSFAQRAYASSAGSTSTAALSRPSERSPTQAEHETDARLHDLKQTEGPHFRDQTAVVPPASSPSSNDLSTPFHGPWTLHSPVYTPSDLSSVRVVRRPFECTSDRVASGLVWSLRKGFDLVSRYKHVPMPKDGRKWTTEELRKRGSTMTPDQWLMRILFLESVAGVPGMVAGALRHLHSLRLMRRDGGWIHSLLEEAENERMHLMTFIAVSKPSFALRSLILLAQGVFYNLFFLGYLLSPRIAHRFVGCLEEEAVVTYTRAIQEMRAGHLPEWEKTPAPEIAVSYWRLPEGATMLDVLENVRADESAHRFVNHTLAGLDHAADFNPFALGEPPAAIKGTLPGFSRAEASAFAAESRRALLDQGAKPSSVEGKA